MKKNEYQKKTFSNVYFPLLLEIKLKFVSLVIFNGTSWKILLNFFGWIPLNLIENDKVYVDGQTCLDDKL